MSPAEIAPHPVPPFPAAPPTATGPDDPPRDLPDLLARLVRRDPDAVVAVDRPAGAGPLPVTRAALWLRTRALTDRLAGAGIGPGDCVAVWLPNWSDALAWQFATAARGAHVIGINTRYQLAEVAHVLTRARPKLVVLAHDFHDLDLGGRLREAVARAEVDPPAVAVSTGPGRMAPTESVVAGYDVGGGAWADRTDPDISHSDEHAAGPGDAGGPSDLDPAALVAAFTTSGSTGLPKLAAHSGAAVLGHALADAAAIGIADGDPVLCALPLSGVFGFNTAMATLAAGGVCVFEPVFDADTVLDDLAAHRIRHVAAGDDLVLRLAQAWRARPRDLSAWAWWGAADFQGRSRELAQWAATGFGTVTVGLYGSSEVFALTALWPPSEPLPARLSGGGRVVHPSIEVRVADPETGAALDPGVEGELQFRGPNVVDAYLGDADGSARAAAFTDDGWFRSGDLGTMVADGVFGYVCRMGDALRLRGFLVDPAEIELRLAAHPDVHTARVVGTPGPDGGTVAVGFVVPVDGTAPDPAQLRRWCAAELAAFKVPATVHVITAMPTTTGTNGTKIRAAVLREWALAGGPPPWPEG